MMAALRADVEALIDGYAVRRHIRLPTTSNTPRRLRSVKRGYIAEHSLLIPTLYRAAPCWHWPAGSPAKRWCCAPMMRNSSSSRG
ncbi:hypothetical protein ACFQ4K_05150 [Tistrella bauzanensis]